MKRDIKRICAYITCAALGIMLLIPLLFFNFDKTKISVVENKKLALPPNIFTENGKLNRGFLKAFDNYFNDNIGFKQNAVIADIAASYAAFGKLKIPNYIMGTEGHVYYIPSRDVSVNRGKGKFSEDDINVMGKGVKDMRDYFSSHSVPFIFMAIPDKDGIYPEYLPKTILNASNENTFDRVFKKLKQTPDVDAFYLEKELLSAKGGDLLYYRNYDPTHWNMNGAFVGYTALMNHIKAYLPEVRVLEKDDFVVTESDGPGTLAQLSSIKMLGETMHWNDKLYTYNLKGGYKSELSNVAPKEIQLDVNSYHYYHYSNRSVESGKKLLMFSDSYSYGFLLPLLAESFSDVYCVSYSVDPAILNQLCQSVKPDCAVLECVERMLNTSVFLNMASL